MNIYRFFRKFDWFHWVYYRAWNRFHVLKLKYVEPGYHDADTLLIHSMFQVLVNFIELEKPNEIVNWESDPEHKHAWEEMNALYEWWVGERQSRDSKNPILQPNIKTPDMHFTPTEKKWINPETKKEESTSKMDFVHDSKEDEEKWEKACEDCTAWEIQCEEEDEIMMKRLIAVRLFMWT